MSSLGGQWRVLRLQLAASASSLQAEAERLLQRRPALWGDLIRRLEKATSVQLMQDSKEVEASRPAAAERQGTEAAEGKEAEPAAGAAGAPLEEGADTSVRGLLQGLRLKKDLHFGNLSPPTWKSNKPLVNKSSIHSRTAYVISALVSARAAACVAKRAEDFIAHLNQYPEARDLAIKEGAVRALLRVQSRLDAEDPLEKEVNGIVKEALALAGWAGPPRGRGPRVLALDGGGIRGLIAIEVLRHLERLTGRRVNDLFDYIIGVSTGAIIAAVIGTGVGTLETASNMYRTLSQEMFGNTSLIGGTSRLVWTHSYYDTAAWERMLRDNLGDLTLTQCNRTDNPKMALVSCAVGPGARAAPFVFRTYGSGFRVRGAVRGTHAARVWHAVRASAAAPTYFAEFRLGGVVHQDGGIMCNNPAGLAVHEARLLYGARALRRATLLSVGTGRAPAPPAPPAAPRGTSSWRDKFDKILDSATDTEGVHLVLNDLLPAGRYFRFNPPLVQPCAMDEVDPRRLQSMLADTSAYIRRNQHKFEQAAEALTRPRSLAQRAADSLQRQALLLGVTAHP